MGRERTHHSYRAVVLALGAFLLAGSLAAQEARGRLTGRVSDTTKAPSPARP